jgi:hypothetical protein
MSTIKKTKDYLFILSDLLGQQFNKQNLLNFYIIFISKLLIAIG